MAGAAGQHEFQVGPVRVRIRTGEEPSRERLTQERIIDVALEQMKERGYEAVSMRSIAKALGTGPASLYAHVRNREELDQLCIDRVAGTLPMPEADPARWDEQLRQMMRDILAVYREHPGVARASMGMIPTTPGAMKNAEAMMALCRAGGIPDQLAAWACDMFSLYVGAVAVEEDIWVERGRAAAEAGRPYGEEEVVAAVHDYFAALPEDEFPLLRGLATVMTTGSGEDRIGFAIDLLVAGLKALARGER